MNYTFKGPGAGPFPYRAQVDQDLICVVGTADGDVTLKPGDYEVRKNTTRPGAVVTLANPLPAGCYLTIGTEDVKTPDNVRPTGSLKAANPEPEKPETVEEQGYAVIRFDGDVDGAFDTTPGEKIIQLKVNAAKFAAKAEYADNTQSAVYASTAGFATTADKAVKAESADKADSAETAQYADGAEYASEAKYAEQSGHAKSADTAKSADIASTAETALYASEAKKARQACQANIATVATTAWEAERLVDGVTVNEAIKAQSADLADRANTAYSATNAALAERAVFADKAEDAYYSETANVANYARRDCKGNLIYDTYLRQDEAENIFVSIDEFTNQLEILEDEKADRSELLKTATVGGKANGHGVVDGNNLELTITSINGLIETDDGVLTPISPQDWFQFINSVSEIQDPTLGYALLDQNAYTFPVNSTQFVFSNGLPADLNRNDIYCIYTNDADGEEQKAVGWSNVFTEDLDKSKIWNIYDDATGLQELPKKHFYRVVYDPVTGWNILTSPVTAVDQGKFDQIYALLELVDQEIEGLKNGGAVSDQTIAELQTKIAELQNFTSNLSLQNFIKFADALDPDALTPDLATAVLA